MHQLVNGLHVEVNKYRRGKDANHFNLVKCLYPHDDEEDIKEALICARASYPTKGGIFTGLHIMFDESMQSRYQ